MKKKTLLTLLLVMILSLAGFAACGENNSAKYEIQTAKIMEINKGSSKVLEYTVTKDGVIQDSAETVVTVISGDSVTYSAETNKVTAVKTGISKLQIALKNDANVKAEVTVNVPLYTITFGKAEYEVFLGEVVNATYTVKKDGARVQNANVKLTVEGDAISVNTFTKEVTAKQLGTATLVATLESDPEVRATATYKVKDTFFNRSLNTRGNIDFSKEDAGNDSEVKVLGGQATVTAKTPDTKFVFKTTIDILSSMSTYSSIGVGSFMDEGNHALWFGLMGTGTDGVYDVYIRDFYKAWDAPAYENHNIGNYAAYNHGTKVDFVIVRDGDDYWYSIGGLTGTYHDNSGKYTEEATYPGVFSQEKMITLTNYTVSYEDADIEQAKNECGKEIAKLEITNANVTLLEKGAAYKYTAVVYSSTAGEKTIAWSVDTTGMTSGKDGVTIDADGTLHLTNDATGYVTVKASCGDKEAAVQIEISQEELNKSTDKVAVSGGVGLDMETNAITFPVERNFNNPTLDLTQYAEVPYMAKLLNTVNGDFTLTFKVKNYAATTANPMLLVSLGGKGNNFVLGKDGVVTGYNYVQGIGNQGTPVDGAYGYMAEGNASATIAGFDATAEHVYKIVVKNGEYHVYLDEAELQFASQAIRRGEDYMADCNVMFTTIAGTSCEVYDIALENQGNTVGNWMIYNKTNASVADGNLVAKFPANSWNGKDNMITRYVYMGGLVPEGTFAIKANIKFGAAQNDTKAVIKIGNFEFQINNKFANPDSNCLEAEYYNGKWGGGKAVIPGAVGDTYVVELQRLDGEIYFYVNGVLVNKHGGVKDAKYIELYTFNENEADADTTVTVSDVQIHTTFLTLEGPSAAKTGLTAIYKATAKGEGEIVWSVDTTGLTAGGATIENGVLSMSADAEGYVTVIATIGTYSKSIKVTASIQEADQDTDVATSKGGVLQDETNGKLIFPVEKATENGVANEENYAESSYYAILNSSKGVPYKVTGNFSVEFTVAAYKTTSQYPKFMISLGGTNEQFYVTYFQDGTAQIQTFTRSFGTDGRGFGGQWVNSEKFDNFDVNEAHTYKIEVVDGFYKVYVDGNEISVFKMDEQVRKLFRNPQDTVTPSCIMFATNQGTSCEVYDISVTCQGADNFETVNSAVTAGLDGFTYNMTRTGDLNDGWQNKEWNSVYYSKYVPANFIATFGVEFSGAMNDNKLEVELGSQLVHIENKLGAGDAKLQICHRSWGRQWYTETNQKFYIKVTRLDGVVKAYVRLATETEWTQLADLDGFASDYNYFKFAAYIGDNGNGSVNVSEMSVMEYYVAKSNNDNLVSVDENSFTLKFKYQDWLGGDYADVATFYNRELPQGNFDITFKASFPTDMVDAKLGVYMGDRADNHEFDICVGGTNKAEIRTIWGGKGADWDVSNLKVTLQVRGDKVTMVINDDYTVGTVDITGTRSLYFYARNKRDADLEKTVTVSDFVVTEVTEVA